VNLICETCNARKILQLVRSQNGATYLCTGCRQLMYINFTVAIDRDMGYTVSEFKNAKDEKAENTFQKDILKKLNQWLPLQKDPYSLHDVGCGTGSFLSLASQGGFFVSGNDIWNEVLEEAILLHGDKVYLGPFDRTRHHNLSAITFLCVIAHFDKPWELIKSLKFCLSPGGIIYFYTPKLCAIDYFCIFLSKFPFNCTGKFLKRRVNNGHRRIYSRKALSIEISKLGFETISLQPIRRYGVRFSRYFLSLGFSKANAVFFGWCLSELGLQKFLPKNQWEVYLRIPAY